MADSTLRKDLQSKTVDELQRLAAERGIASADMKKAELVAALEQSYTEYPPRIG